MGNPIFFVGWELWQQMTFVLAMCIVAVFCLGLAKLWHNNRLMRKQEIIDEEKRARVSDMRKTGVPVSTKRGADIPFGVRAIQGGVEVDGIWISRPATPTNLEAKSRVQSSTTLVGIDSADTQPRNKKGKGTTMDDSAHSQSDASIFQRMTDVESLASNGSGTPRKSQFASGGAARGKAGHRVGGSALNEDTLRRLEGHGATRTAFDTYVPARSPRRPSHSGSSSGESVDSQPQSGVSARSGSGMSYTSSGSSRMYRTRLDARPAQKGQERRGDPYESSGSRTPISPATLSYSANQSPMLAGSEHLHAPEPTFGPGDMHVNKSSRRANQGVEVLRDGTFATPGHGRARRGDVDADGFEEQRLSPRPQGRAKQMSYSQTLQAQNASQNF